MKRERDDKKRLDKSRGFDSKKWVNVTQKPSEEAPKKDSGKN